MKLLKAIIGDICGSRYEFQRVREEKKPETIVVDNECHFTDDTVCTVAIAEAILDNPDNPDFDRFLRRYVAMYPHAGYGERFIQWAFDEREGDSFGNGCCMRQYPISLYYDINYLRKAMLAKSCSGSHNHPLSYVYVSLVDDVINYPNTYWGNRYFFTSESQMEFSKHFNIDSYRENYGFNCTCAGSVPEAIAIALNSKSYDDIIANAIYLGGDVDTIACIAGMCTPHNPSEELERLAISKLPERMINIITKFEDEIKLNQQGNQ